MNKKIKVVLTLTVFSLMILSGCGTKKLSGDYTAKINLILTEATATLRFNGDKVSEVDEDGKEFNEGTYKITDNELVITHSNNDISTAELSKDKRTFTVKSAEGVSGAFMKDVKFTKKEK